ncbi:MAG TPA: prolyl oligopeptidase family serine peptidase [Blastocatellia bacterium]|nr:prolyl oligopeptidase family serine peptidase [Blastocatellia bacterium]
MRLRLSVARLIAVTLTLIWGLTLPFGALAGTGQRSARRSTSPAAPPPPQLTLEAISRDPGKWAGTPPSQIRWTEDGSKLHFQWNPERQDRAELYELDIRTPGATPRKVADEEKRWLSSNPGDRNAAGTLKVYAFQGDLYLHDIRSGRTRQITRTADAESNPRFSFDERSIVYQRGDNLFEWVIETGETRQITDFRRGRDPEEKPKLSRQDEYLEKQQLELFEIIRKQDKEEKEQKERTKRERGPFPDPTYLKENESVTSLQLSPDRKFVTFILNDRTEAARAKIPEMPKYVTRSGYVETERLATQIGGTGRVKVGAPQVQQKLGVMDTETGAIRYVDMGLGKREYGFQLMSPEAGPFGGPGGVAVQWSDDGRQAFCVLRARDNKDRWIVLLDVAQATARILDAEHDDAWILSQGPYGWLADNRTIWFRSERDGYFHLYTISIDGGPARPLTSGRWEITGVQLSRDKKTFYITASEPHPGERHFYSLPVTGGSLTRITSGEGVYSVTLSPDEKWMAVIYTNPDMPPDLYLMENRPGAPMTRLTDSYTDEFKSYRWRKFEIVTIPDADGNLLYARLYKPDVPHPTRPAVIYVHGAGYAQSVFKNWGGFGTTPFFNVLLQAGYTVLDLDYRGSSGYGRDCRTAIYRNMGGKDVDSAVAAARWLAQTQGIDPRRIGIYGGSYGGFFTLMALFKHPGVFAAGAALYPVTDWAHYNHPYTSNILNLPYEDEEAYRRSSPIYHADGLKDRLLILHGMHDRNVHYQDTIRLVQRLIELKKTGWELATMPIEDHGWQNESSRLDSYRRIFNLFEEVLKRPLPPLTVAGQSSARSSRTGMR